jgi:iron complex transport system substrate-binding protein
VGAELGRVLVELGLGPAVVGVDSPSLAAPELAHALDLGEGVALSAELARSLAPELVLVLAGPSDPAAAFAASLGAQGIPAHVLAPRDANEVLDAIARIGRLTGRELRAAALAARLTREVAEVATLRDGQSRLRVAWVIAGEPLVVVGGSGLLHELLELAGAENAFHTPQEERLAPAAAELAARAPDVVLGAPAFLPAVPGAKGVAADPALAALPLLDLPARVRTLHALLYPKATP